LFGRGGFWKGAFGNSAREQRGVSGASRALRSELAALGYAYFSANYSNEHGIRKFVLLLMRNRRLDFFWFFAQPVTAVTGLELVWHA
jgi:hypothetical protein